MENIKHIFFSFNYINQNNEIDKIIKNKYILNEEGKISQNELISQIIKHKKDYPYKVVLHEIILYHNDCEPVKYYLNFNNEDYINKLSHINDIYLKPAHFPFNNLSKFYVFFKTRNFNHNSLTKKIKFTNSKNTRKSKHNLYNI
jgi:hypothetical protein